MPRSPYKGLNPVHVHINPSIIDSLRRISVMATPFNELPVQAWTLGMGETVLMDWQKN
jgi:hypothetical protein